MGTKILWKFGKPFLKTFLGESVGQNITSIFFQEHNFSHCGSEGLQNPTKVMGFDPTKVMVFDTTKVMVF